ncbi:MAG: sugar kinase [Chloroflexota bacterium]
MLDVIGLGETMVAFQAMDFGPLRDVHRFKKWVGGACDNVIVGLARLGFTCGWFSRVGDDEFGREIVRAIRGEGVDVSHVITDGEAPTGVFFVEKRAEGDFKCYFYRKYSAATRLCPEDIREDYLARAKMLCPEGITAVISDSARRAVEKMFSVARKNGQVVVFDPNLRLTLCDVSAARLILVPMMQQSSYVLPGEEELMLLMDANDIRSAIDKAHSLGIKNLIIKRGAQGATVAVAGQEAVDVPGFQLKHVISTMGAGDAFVAGFTAGLLKGQPLDECARWGNGVAAFCLMADGPYHADPSFHELQGFLAGRSPVSR